MKQATKPIGNKPKRKTPLTNDDTKALYARAILITTIQEIDAKLQKLKEANPEREFLTQEKTLNDLVLVSEQFVHLVQSQAANFKRMTSLSILASQKTSENSRLKEIIRKQQQEIEELKSNI